MRVFIFFTAFSISSYGSNDFITVDGVRAWFYQGIGRVVIHYLPGLFVRNPNLANYWDTAHVRPSDINVRQIYSIICFYKDDDVEYILMLNTDSGHKTVIIDINGQVCGFN
ncbi:hypothetical protein NX722_14115 [Endozoicomonas gorgoniicola]|uniref:Uncharacterized protein n=1 Tax=Endozoicomonas gorgoniicola TaxID=1234144 RepID=A0ABT3MWI4_9GAMM|nr:hypothetical protein [Endozoicomonas gorgoniicola]MCW7553745.1 hypothetical protein [Endozoicomonas gorgoniicola]